jgi:alkylation response protein AidB-like acyl-CoA dehydrogenase
VRRFDSPLADEEQRQHHLPGLCRGDVIGLHATTEPDSGSDAFATSDMMRRIVARSMGL